MTGERCPIRGHADIIYRGTAVTGRRVDFYIQITDITMNINRKIMVSHRSPVLIITGPKQYDFWINYEFRTIVKNQDNQLCVFSRNFVEH